jgi:FixJ family two-component response regulator
MSRAPETSSGTICIVGADVCTQKALANLLGALDTPIRVFESAEEFLAVRDSVSPLCLIAAVALPGISGLDLLAELQSKGRAVPTILLASDGGVSSAVAALRAGAADYFKQPIPERALYRSVAGIVRDRSAEGVLSPASKATAEHI